MAFNQEAKTPSIILFECSKLQRDGYTNQHLYLLQQPHILLLPLKDGYTYYKQSHTHHSPYGTLG